LGGRQHPGVVIVAGKGRFGKSGVAARGRGGDLDGLRRVEIWRTLSASGNLAPLRRDGIRARCFAYRCKESVQCRARRVSDERESDWASPVWREVPPRIRLKCGSTLARGPRTGNFAPSRPDTATVCRKSI